MPESDIVLTMQGVYKSFPGVKALQNVDFMLRKGEVHSLMGENGAGKSTLIKVLTGVYPMDEGTVLLNGKTIHPQTPLEAQQEGISTVYQEVNLCPNLTVAENIFIGRQPRKQGRLDWKTMNMKAREILARLNLHVDVTKTLDQYTVAIQQMIAIARAVSVNSKVLILDEPTSSLNELETKQLFTIIRQLKKEGLGIVFVSHFLEQIYEICDHITVLRNGELVGDYPTKELPRVELISKMLGKDMDTLANFDDISPKTEADQEVLLRAQGIERMGNINMLNLEIQKGEVLGFAGLLGSGRTETARLLFGADKVDHGTIYMHGRPVRLNSTLDAMKQKIGYCPEDRKKEGIIQDLSVRENIILAMQVKKGMLNHISMKEQEQIADKFIKMLQIKVSSREQLIKNLSGGNQQKVIIARWLATNPDLLILDEPTRGIDIGTKNEIQKMMMEFAKYQGMSVIFISSEIDEMIRTCSRLIVFKDHEKIQELSGSQLNTNTVMATIAKGGTEHE